MSTPIDDQDLLIHVLNVGFGDCIVIEFPAEGGVRHYGLVDCNRFSKARGYLEKLRALRPGDPQLKFVCATHPHLDHIRGLENFVTDDTYQPAQFWDSGFRHSSKTYEDILTALHTTGVEMVRVSSGMEWYFGRVQVTALAPSIALRNRYATYGIDMNNASIVLRLEHHGEDVVLMQAREYTGTSSREAERNAGRSVVILAGDAEFDSWSHIVQEFPRLERTSANNPLVKKLVNYLACSVVKVAHHGSMHSTGLDVYEKMRPEHAIISTKQEQSTKIIHGTAYTRDMFPHETAVLALVESEALVQTTDGSLQEHGPGSVVIVVPPGGTPRLCKLDDEVDEVPDPPQEV
jgi:beta-lactamase superfamily II metal-dependent hydrolase